MGNFHFLIFYPLSIRIFYPTSRIDSPSGIIQGRHAFNDLRLEQRYEQLLNSLCSSQTHRVSSLCSDWAGQTAGYRFFNNPRVSLSELVGLCSSLEADHIKGRDILALIDGSSIGLSCKKKRPSVWQGMGVIDDNHTPGFYIYPCLVLDRLSGAILGLADICLFTRPKTSKDRQANQKQKLQRTSLCFQHKESSVWSLVTSNAGQVLEGARSVTYVMDRGGDIYDSIHEILEDKDRVNNLIIRSKHDRKVICSQTGVHLRMSKLIGQISPAGRRKVPLRQLFHLSKTNRKMIKRQAREAVLEIRYAKIRLACPRGHSPLGKSLWIVHGKELPCSIPKGEKGVEWTIITSLPVECFQQACAVLDFYQQRWWIEQLFRILKKDGIDIERIELQGAEAIKAKDLLDQPLCQEALKCLDRQWP